MSGRGKGRGGRGKPQSRSTYNHPQNKENKEVKKNLTDWYYHLGSATTGVAFEQPQRQRHRQSKRQKSTLTTAQLTETAER